MEASGVDMSEMKRGESVGDAFAPRNEVHVRFTWVFSRVGRKLKRDIKGLKHEKECQQLFELALVERAVFCDFLVCAAEPDEVFVRMSCQMQAE